MVHQSAAMVGKELWGQVLRGGVQNARAGQIFSDSAL